MAKKKVVKSSHVQKILLGGIGVAIIISLLGVIGYFGYEYTYTNKIYPGVAIAGQSVSGLDFVSAARLITNYKTELQQTGLVFTYNDETFVVPVISDTVPLIDIQTDKTVQAAFGVGRGSGAQGNLKQKISALTFGTDQPLLYDSATATIVDLLAAEFDDSATPYRNASFDTTTDPITVLPHSDGTKFNWPEVLAEMETQLNTLQPVHITLELEADPAPVTTTIAEQRVAEAEAILDLAPVTLTYEDNTYTIERDELAGWLTTELTFAEAAIRTSLDPIAADINIPVKEGRFSLDIVAGEVKLTQFEDGADGLEITLDKTIAALNQTVLGDRQSTVELVVEVAHPKATPDSLDDLGIKELLGTGTTNFAGSPSNRIANIRRGADLVNGLLVAPGETFSLLDTLRPFDAANGWLPELVIKGNKLEKELGGGLCQIGSTSFRAAMMSGQEIAERRSHSWAVSYYNYNGKAGVDATIYDPAPDFKFKNSTEHYILWRTRIEGYDIYFEMWGTDDGRNGYFTEPVNYGYVSPGPTEEVVDETLPPDTRNCAQHAYTGVSASFDYIIEWADGRTDTQNFTSVYKAQPARCLVGPEPEAETTEADTEDAETDTAEEADADRADDTKKKKKKD